MSDFMLPDTDFIKEFSGCSFVGIPTGLKFQNRNGRVKVEFYVDWEWSEQVMELRRVLQMPVVLSVAPVTLQDT